MRDAADGANLLAAVAAAAFAVFAEARGFLAAARDVFAVVFAPRFPFLFCVSESSSESNWNQGRGFFFIIIEEQRVVLLNFHSAR